jgi:hypothetical protein
VSRLSETRSAAWTVKAGLDDTGRGGQAPTSGGRCRGLRCERLCVAKAVAGFWPRCPGYLLPRLGKFGESGGGRGAGHRADLARAYECLRVTSLENKFYLMMCD